jgi:hypothetical protein
MIDDILAFAGILVGLLILCLFIFLCLFAGGLLVKIIATVFLMGWSLL